MTYSKPHLFRPTALWRESSNSRPQRSRFLKSLKLLCPALPHPASVFPCFLMIRRRQFITLLGGAAVASPFVARAQQAMPVIGFLGVETPNVFAGRVRAFRQGLSEMGYVEGRNVSIMFQWAGGHYDLLPTLADELVRQRACCRYLVFDKVN